MENHSIHIPVLVDEVTQLLSLKPGEVAVDATVGDGGHAQLILSQISPGGFLIGIDQDPEATEIAYENLSRQKSNAKFVVVHGSFSHLGGILKDAGYQRADAILFDLGISSRELLSKRGFSFQFDAPLDMRFNPEAPVTAADIVNSYSKEKIAQLLWEFGEERASRRIAEAIFMARRKGKITSTLQLAEIVTAAKGGRPQHSPRHPQGSRGRQGRIHPATQTFQALRIAVNDELKLLAETLPQAIQLLNPAGRIAVISYHSLEDRIVKNIFRDAARAGVVQLITKKPVRPTREEVLKNPRARSAKLRVINKLN